MTRLRLSALAAGLLLVPVEAQPAPDGAARPVGPCSAQQVCIFEDPEDLADVVGTKWLIVGQATGVVAFDTKARTIISLPTGKPDPACPLNLAGGGIGLRREGADYRLVRILHARGGGPDAVASYRLTIAGGRPVLRAAGCVIAPAPYFLNDIAPLPAGGFAATHMFDRSRPRPELDAAFLAGEPTGFVVRWSTTRGWQQLPGTEGSFPNGLDVSSDGRFLAFAETYGHAINRIRLDGSDRQRIALPMNPDNVVAMPHGRFSVVGGTGAPLVSTRPCPTLRRPGCGFPALAVRADFATAKAIPLATSDGAGTPGFSVGLTKNGRLYLGTAFGDRVTILPLGRLPAALP